MIRIYHTWDEWECYPAGFYNSRAKDKSLTDDQCREMYRDFLSNLSEFEIALRKVLSQWPNSCEHYLSNENMNRIAWLGQSSMCIAHGIPSRYRGGFNMLSSEQQNKADLKALKYLNRWLILRGESPLTLSQAQSKTEANLY